MNITQKTAGECAATPMQIGLPNSTQSAKWGTHGDYMPKGRAMPEIVAIVEFNNASTELSIGWDCRWEKLSSHEMCFVSLSCSHSAKATGAPSMAWGAAVAAQTLSTFNQYRSQIPTDASQRASMSLHRWKVSSRLTVYCVRGLKSRWHILCR